MKNIIFSTTRGWNPGDEFILAGVRRILDELGVSYNPVIYNRHPDIRSQRPQLFKRSKVPYDFHLHDETFLLEANLKFGFFDNSLKPDTDCAFADWVILAGTPEWCNGRMWDLYCSILRHNIPVMILGVGGNFDLYDEGFRDVVKKAKAFTVRDQTTQEVLKASDLQARLLPCPALLSAPPAKTRQVEEVRRIGLIYQATRDETVIWNGFSEEAFVYMRELYRRLMARYEKDYAFEFVCHYIDEMPLAKRDYPGMEILYSYEPADYFDIYSRYDFVIGPRVHGIGASASLGIPGVALTHDMRGSTCAGFLAPQIAIGDDIGGVLEIIHAQIQRAPQKSKELAAHRSQTLSTYKEIVSQALADPQVVYEKFEPKRKGREFHLNNLRLLAKFFQSLEEKEAR